MVRAVQFESRADRRQRARSLAGFFAAGALLSATVLVLPGWDDLHTAGIAVTVILAAVTAAGLYVASDHAGRSVIHVVTASGTGLIAACQVLAGGGSPTAMYAMLYIWVVLHASLFSSRGAVAGHLVLTTLAHAAALVGLGDLASIAPQLALTLGTQLATALIVTSLARQQRELADTDSLTGMGNRRVADRALEWALEHTARRPSWSVCVAQLDLDGFKALNDEQGHAAGDRALVEVAAVWSGLLRTSDTLARIGGDEFLLVLMDCDLAEARGIVARMIASTPGQVTCSAGLACWDRRETPEALMERADQALYAAKADGPLAIAAGGESEAASLQA